jgi:hypothetical protein
MTNEITESQMLNFCEDLRELFKKHQLIMGFAPDYGNHYIDPYDEDIVEGIIEEINVMYYHEW